MRSELKGRARVLGDDINTDYIILSARKRETLDPNVLKQYLLETVDPAFAQSVRSGDLLVAGEDFGCGSAMEVAVTVILAAGIKAVLARSFSRTYYRNAINNGLIPIECDTGRIEEGHALRVMLDEAGVRVMDETSGIEMRGKALPVIMLEILDAGGLVPYIRARGDYAGTRTDLTGPSA